MSRETTMDRKRRKEIPPRTQEEIALSRRRREALDEAIRRLEIELATGRRPPSRI
jgi:hypothetical protein